ncbi:PEP-CTERM sorting domain-containing protein [Nostoc sp. UHCC 0702]|nr:PEP-CTERM sorting domain-containing protein [Nostoc sp. UHCC 0702]
MSTCPKFLAVVAGTFLSLVTIDVNSAQAGNFTFTKIADSRDFLYLGGGPINDNGTVAFAAGGADDFGLPSTGIFTGNGGAFTTVVNFNLGFNAINGIAINNSGTVAFANNSLPQEGLFISNGENVTTVATPSDNLFTLNLSSNAFNNSGTLVFKTFEAIVTGNGGPLTTIVDTSGPFQFFSQDPVINDANVVAFEAELKDGRQGVFTSKDGTITTIADNTSSFFGGFSEFDINNTETVIFSASLENGEQGIFTGDGKTITTVADTSGLFSSFFRLAINDNNQVAFNGELRGGPENDFADGIFTGSDPIADKVIGVGDSLLGGTVTDVFFSGGLNNSGQISFYAEYIDDTGNTITGVFRADPVLESIPESSSTLGLLTVGTLGTGVVLKRKLKQKLT